jgi:transposase, IS5 family
MSTYALKTGIPQNRLAETLDWPILDARSAVFPSDSADSFRLTKAKDDPRAIGVAGGLDQGDTAPVTTQNVARRSVVADLSRILDSPEIVQLVEQLQATRWTGRPGYPLRAMIGMALAKSLYALPTWTRTVALVDEHSPLAAVIAPDGDVPSVYACYRFTAKLRDHAPMLQHCIADVVEALKEHNPALGQDVAIDASDMPAFANGQRFVSKGGRERAPEEYSDPDASWGHRSAISTRKGGGFYGYRIHMAVCSKTDLPLAWTVETAKAHETNAVEPLLDKLHTLGIDPQTCAMDRGYDTSGMHDACATRGIAPVIPLKQTPAVKRGEHKPPCCEHGEWTFAGADRKRNAAKWRCPTGECKPASLWIKADRLHPLIPYKAERWKGLYRKRASVERSFGRLKNDAGLAPLRVRGIERVRLHANLTVLSQLMVTLNRKRSD